MDTMAFQHVHDIMCLVEVDQDASDVLYHDNDNSSSNDYEKWFPNNNFIINSPENTITFDFDTDPLLSEAQIFDPPAILEGLDIVPQPLPPPKKPKPKEPSVTTAKPIKKKGKEYMKSNRYPAVIKKEIISDSDLVKNNILKDKRPETVEIVLSTNVTSITFKEKGGKQMFMIQQMQVPDHYARPERIQKVMSVTLFRICKTLDYNLPQVVTNFGMKIHLCPLRCNKAFLHIADAKLHALQHMQIKPYKCDKPDCPWEFYTSSKLHRHKETHDKAKNFVCHFGNCTKAFSTVYNLNEHIRKHNLPACLPCTVIGCNLSFQNETQRKLHYKTHDRSEAPFKCANGKCQRAFFSQVLLESHLRACKESDIICRYPGCGKTFKNCYRLREHIRQHTGVKPYHCTFESCTWRFPTASKLKRHQSIHTRDRKYHCTIGDCTKSFFRSEHLKDHTLTHLDKKAMEAEATISSATQSSDDQDEIATTEDLNLERLEQEQLQAVQAIQGLSGAPSDVILGTGLIPDESLTLLANGSFSTVNLRDLD